MRRWKTFFTHWETWLGLLLVLVFLAGAVFAPVISPQDPKNPGAFKQVGRSSDFVPHPPDEKALLGTLPGQYDVFHTLIWGMRDAMQFGLLVAVGSFLIGILFGSAAGYAGGLLNSVMMRVADAFLTFPPLAGAVFLQQLAGITITSLGGLYYFNTQFFGRVVSFNGKPTPLISLLSKVDPLMIALILFSWVPYARLVNSMVLGLTQTDFVQSARALGGSPAWVIRRHLIPNSIGPAIVLGARDVGSAVILQATLTFIGLAGASPWGTLLSMGRNFVLGPGGSLLTHWWVFVPATVAVILFGVAWNLLGDGLNDVLDPTSHYSFRPRGFRRSEAMDDSVPLPAGINPGVAQLASPQPLPGEGAKRPVSGSPLDAPAPAGADPVLQTARDRLSQGDLEGALQAYGHLIRRGRRLDEILPDLAQLVKKHPRDPLAWQTLGDALVRAGDTAHAAQSYEQARKLMQ